MEIVNDTPSCLRRQIDLEHSARSYRSQNAIPVFATYCINFYTNTKLVSSVKICKWISDSIAIDPLVFVCRIYMLTRTGNTREFLTWQRYWRSSHPYDYLPPFFFRNCQHYSSVFIASVRRPKSTQAKYMLPCL